MKLLKTALIAGSCLADESGYQTPAPEGSVHFYESFDSADAIDGWTRSDNEKYAGGKWAVEALAKEALEGDQVNIASFVQFLMFSRASLSKRKPPTTLLRTTLTSHSTSSRTSLPNMKLPSRTESNAVAAT